MIYKSSLKIEDGRTEARYRGLKESDTATVGGSDKNTGGVETLKKIKFQKERTCLEQNF